MKKTVKYIVITAIILIAAFLYYYVTLPAFNIHSVGTWWFVIGAVIVIGIFITARKMIWEGGGIEHIVKNRSNLQISINITTKIFVGIVAALLLILAIGALLSSPIINAKKYQQLMSVEDRDFTRDITEVDYNTIPILDKDSAALLGNRKMGSMVDMVSQFEVSGDYSQINVNNKPVRVTPLVYASPIKWLTNQSKGIPAYIKIDMATQDTECVKLKQGIKYSTAEV